MSQPSDKLTRASVTSRGSTRLASIGPVLEEHELSFLIDTSFLEELDVEVIRTVYDGPFVDLRLLYQKAPAEISPLDRHGHAFVVHPVLREELLDEFRRYRTSKQVAEMQTRAAEVLQQLGRTARATKLFLAAGRPREAATAFAVGWAEPNRFQWEASDLNIFDGHDLQDFVPHRVTVGLVKGYRGDLEAVRDSLEFLEGAEWSGPLPHGFRDLETALIELRELLPGTPVDAATAIETLGEVDADRHTRFQMLDWYHAAYLWYYEDRPEESDQLLDRVLVGHASLGRRSIQDKTATVLAFGLRAIIKFDEGRVNGASAAVEAGERMLTVYDLQLSELPTEVFSLAQAIAGNLNVRTRTQSLTQLLHSGTRPGIPLHAGLELARLTAAEGAIESAIAVLTELEKIVESEPQPPLLVDRLRLLQRSLGVGADRVRARGLSVSVTNGERAVLNLLADESLTQPQISKTLGVSLNTTKSHLRSIYQKFGVKTRQQAVQHAKDHGLLAVSTPWRERRPQTV